MDINTYLWIVLSAGVMALIFAFIKTNWISKQDQGTDEMELIGKSIAEGSMAFLRAEYRVLGVFVLIIALLLGFANAGRQDSSAFISLEKQGVKVLSLRNKNSRLEELFLDLTQGQTGDRS